MTIEPGFFRNALGSALVTAGRTRVACAASLGRVPPFVSAGGWLTAEYSMLPGSTSPRASRDPGGRGKEIQRLIGRSLRAAVDLSRLGGAEPGTGVALTLDCDVLDADGGTRTAAISGAWVALRLALDDLMKRGLLASDPIIAQVAAVSVGVVEYEGQGRVVLDLPYDEDSRATVDCNVVAAAPLSAGGVGASGPLGLVEVQGTGEQGLFDRGQLDAMLDAAEVGIRTIFAAQLGAR